MARPLVDQDRYVFNLQSADLINPFDHKMKFRKKIGVKYCGGCNPTYERVEMVQRIQSLMEDRFIFLRHDEQDLDVLVLMNGCLRACAGKNFNQTKLPYHSIIRESDFESLIDWLMDLYQFGKG